MANKDSKAVKTQDNGTLELRRHELEERKFEHQRWMDEQNLKKAPPNLSRRLAITMVIVGVLSPLATGVVNIWCARLGLESKGMEIKNQDVLSARELKFKVASFLMGNWRDLNRKTPTEKQFFASLFEDALSPSESIHLLANLEKTAPPATKAIWRDAKDKIVNAQPAAAVTAMTQQIAETVEAHTQEIKISEYLRGPSSTNSATVPWIPGSLGSNSSLINDMGKNPGNIPAVFNLGTTSAPPYYGYAVSSQEQALPASFRFKGGTGVGDDYLGSHSSLLTSVGAQLASTPSVIGGPQITLTVTNGQLTTDLYGTKTPSYLNDATSLKQAYALGDAGLGSGDTIIRIGTAYSPDALTGSKIVNVGIDINGGANWSLPKTLGGTDTGLGRFVDTQSGLLTTDITKSRAGLAGYSPTLLDGLSGGSPSIGGSTIKLEKISQPVLDAAKIRVQ